jgi:hypothetical protein
MTMIMTAVRFASHAVSSGELDDHLPIERVHTLARHLSSRQSPIVGFVPAFSPACKWRAARMLFPVLPQA